MARRFYGDKKIETAEDQGDFVILTFKDDSIKLPKKLFEVSVTRDSTDMTTLWDKQVGAVTKEVLDLLLSWDLQLEQLDYLINMLKNSIEHNLGKAGDKLWGKKLSERRMSDVDNILKDEQNGK